MQHILSLSLIILFTSCANLGPKFKHQSLENDQKAKVYVYRVKRFGGAIGSPYICMNQELKGETVNNSYLPILVKPGHHQMRLLVAGKTSAQINFRVKKGKTYYARFEAPLNNGSFKSLKGSTQSTGALGRSIVKALRPSSAEKLLISKNLDTSVQKSSTNAGFLFVKPKLALKEISETQLFHAPKYKKNHCQ